MPRLCRLRLVSIGHPSARFSDVTLDFRDAAGRATHSTLWLRNGGGKSSLLNLFFATVRPNRREFLGTKGETGKRKLEDYVLAGDSAIVACEWELDADADTLDYGGIRHFITGIFFERVHTSRVADDGGSGAEGGDLRRLFFACLVDPSAPGLALESLPIFSGPGQPRARRRLSNFRQEWLSLRDRYPQQEVAAIDDNQRSWQELLSSRGIDPELYYYQVRMNEREGGADQIFVFEDGEDFCDFLLGMVLNPEEVKPIRDNVAVFQEQLLRRAERLVPEQELCRCLLVPLTNLSEIWRNRNQLRADCRELAVLYARLDKQLQTRLKYWRKTATDATVAMEEARNAASQANERATTSARRAAVMFRHYWNHRLQDAKATLAEAQTTMQDAAEAEALWEAAIPLQQAMQHERQADKYREQLRQKRVDWAPLLDRLQKAGTDLAAALREESEAQRGLAAGKRQEADQASRQGDQFEQAAREATGAAATAAARAEELRRRLQSGQDARDALERVAVVLSSESPAESIARIGQQITNIEGQRESMQHELPATETRLSEANETKQAAIIEQKGILDDRSRMTKSLDDAQSKSRAIEQNDTLRRLLDLEHVELARCLEQAIIRSREERGRAQDQIVQLRLQAAVSDRAFRTLEERGLLPPSVGVQTLIDFLRPKLHAAWSGWEYIAENFPTNEERRAVVERLPHIAVGVLVRTEDFGKARSLLSSVSLDLEEPIVVAPLSVLKGAGVENVMILGPTSDAFIDRSAATRELHRLRTASELRGHEEQRLHAWQSDLERLERQLERYRDDHPSGWFDTQKQNLEHADAKLEGVGTRIADADAQIARLTGRRSEIRSAELRTSEELRQLYIAKTQVEQYQRDHGACREVLAQDEAKQLEIVKTQGAKAVESSLKGKESRVRSQKVGEDAQHMLHQTENLDTERTRIRYGNKDAASACGQVEQLRFEYESLRSQYEQQVGAESLEALANLEDSHAGQARTRLDRVLQKHAGLTAEHVAEELQKLPPNKPVDVRYQESKDFHWKAKQATGNASRTHDQIAESSTEAVTRCVKLEESGPLEKPEVSVLAEDALSVAQAAESEAKSLKAEVESHIVRQEKLNQESIEAAHQAEILEKEAEGAAAMMTASQGLLPNVDGDPGASIASELIRDNAFKEHIGTIAAEINRLRSRHQDLDQKRANITTQVHRVARDPKYAGLKNSVAPRFGEFEDAALESRSEQLVQELDLRVKTIQADIDEADRHRDLIIRQTLSVAEDALRSLRAAAASSRLPETLAHVGGKQFLRITTHEPANPVERRSRVAELIESLITQGEIPNEVKLVQLAVRRLGRPINVRVLHPDPDRAGDTVDITEMNRLSGGERLTGSILLYCTLAQLRARNRGQQRRPSSTLLLDNPIGRASRPRFIEIQREFAEQMQVQLVYATGVNDLEAISILPNRIRLRNDRVDRNSGHHLVEHVPSGMEQAGIIDAVRVGRTVVAPETAATETESNNMEGDHALRP